nr:hypothetical protein [Acidobacteriota bacterium]
EERNNLNNIRPWPRLSKIISRLEQAGSPVVPFIKYLDDWLYRELCEETHIEPAGLSRLGMYFLPVSDMKAIGGDDYEEKLNDKLEEFRSTQVWIAITLILSLMSEIEIHFRFELDQRLAFIWTMVNEGSEIAKEIYDKRYESLLVPS